MEKTNKSNGYAIAGFVLSFFFTILGLVFSIIGLSKSKEYNGNGKGLAIAGIILSVLHLVTLILLVVAAGAFTFIAWPEVQSSIEDSIKCTTAIDCIDNEDGTTMSCKYIDENEIEYTITCEK